MLPILESIFFQLLSSYQPSQYLASSPTLITPAPIINQVSTPAPIPTDFKTIAVLGDSMIQTLGDNISELSTSLSSYYPDTKFTILNFGRGSTTLLDAQNRLPIIVAQQPDLVVIESFAYNNFGNTPQGLNQQTTIIQSLIDQIRQQLPSTKIVLAATIAPDTVHFASGVKDLSLTSLERLEKTKTIRYYLQNLIDFATQHNLPLANAYTPSLLFDSGNPEYISSIDNIHPSYLGNKFFCQILAQSIANNHLMD